ncbi:MAG: cytochrome d ubiquinol oxidase subunit II [Fibromonadaceae bacterium]|jgi:cytochrome d ubiquinol oxidase subunit II|nr:cytochrome d ubiquinol oxidase subunit II [Fibromonadaceae bacterium]
MSLEIFWFVFIAVLLSGFFFLEGFDFGVGILQFFLGKNDRERRTYISSIGPHWDGNEVWLLTAVGATFAAFPAWYATLFSALYLPFVVLLLALIARGVCFEFRHRAYYSARLRIICDITLMVSSLFSAFLVGIIMANLLIGIPIDLQGNFAGSLSDLLKPTALFAGMLGFSLFLSNGALFLNLKIEGELQERVCKISKILISFSVFLFSIMTIFFWKHSATCLVAFVFVLASAVFVFRKNYKLAFISLGLCIACSVAALFYALFPNVLISTLAENNLNIWNTASSKYTLKIMSISAAIFFPIILAYQIWSYYVFRKRISPRSANLEV